MRFPLAVLAAVVTLATRSGAQVLSSEEAAHSGIVLTPIGALPEVDHIDNGDEGKRVEVQLRYGLWKSPTASVQFQNFGVTGLYRVAHRLALGGTLGYRNCGNCEGLLLASADANVPLWHQTNERRGEGFIDIALKGSLGFGRADTTRIRALSAGAWIPVSVSLPEPNDALITITFSPGVAYGYLTDNSGHVLGYVGSDGGTRGMIGGGFSYIFRSALGIHATLHRVILSNSPTQFGLAASYRFGATKPR